MPPHLLHTPTYLYWMYRLVPRKACSEGCRSYLSPSPYAMFCHLLEADVGDVLLGGVLAVVGLGVVLVHLPVPLLVLLLQRCDTSRRLVGSSTCCWPRWSPKMRWYICSLDCALSELWRPGPSARPPNLSSPSPVSSYRARRVGSLEIRAVNEPSQNSPSSLFKVPTSAILQLRIL